MIKDFELAGQYVIYDLVIRTLERDISVLPNLKTGRLLNKQYEDALAIARKEMSLIKQQMRKVELKFDSTEKIDDMVTTFTFLQRGYDQTLRYMNIALRNHTINEIEKLFKLS